MKVRNCLLLLFTCISFLRLNAQPPPADDLSKYSFNYRKIIPGMPENASLGAYGNIPMNTAKGLPNISFPLYTVSKGGVDVPISISFLSSGVAYNEIASAVGKKWSLDAGGSVNRSVNGLADEDYLLNNLATIDPAHIEYQNLHVNSYNTQDSSERIAENGLDCSLDYYYYNFPGHSGSMYLGKGERFRADKEFGRLKIDYTNHFDTFIIKDDAGNTYIFGNDADQSTIYSTGKYNKQALGTMGARVSWKLNKIITATKQQINFEYISYYYEYISLDSERWTAYMQGCEAPYASCPGTGGYYYIGCNEGSYQTTRFVNTARLISKIYTDDQEVLFSYAEDESREVFQKRLSEIKVYSKISADTIKKFTFTGGEYLTGFTETDKNNHNYGKTYTFSYSGGTSIGPYSKNRDFFGYANGSSNGTLMANAAAFSYYYPFAMANRRVSDHYVKSGTLAEITYPTGGKTQFEYETNRMKVGPDTFYAPGVRVKSISDIDATGDVYNKKNFYYRDLVGGSTYTERTINNENTFNLEPTMVGVFHSEEIDPYNSDAFFYRKVITENIGRTGTGKRLIEIDYYDLQNGLFDRGSPLLVKKNIYKTDTFHLQQSILYDYELIQVDSVATPTFTLRKAVPYLGNYSYEGDPTVYPFCPPVTIYQGFDQEHILKPMVYNLESVTTKEYSEKGDSLVSVTSNTYNGYGLIEKTEITGSDNAVSKVAYAYPADFPANATLDRMKDSFMISPVIREQYLTHTNTVKKEKENTYAFNSNGFFTVSNQVIKDVPAGKTQTLNFYGYNAKGQLLSTGRTGEATKSYIWDYLNELPIAEVINADTLSIAYTSFEADGKGRWTFSGSPAADSTSVTGRKTYGLSGGAITRTGLNSSLRYFISYWSKGSSISIAGTQAGWPKTLAAINRKGQAWTLYEHKITGQTSISLSGSLSIDELRLYPENAQMTTYTYQPLTGVTSQCDANGRIVYYEYDGLQRLVLVRDQYQNVVKRICYNIKGQQEDCQQSIYWNKAISNAGGKDCGPGYTGTHVIYSIPAGKYSSSVSQAIADSLALDDLLTNGPSYVNENSTCVPIYYNVFKDGTFEPTVCDLGYIPLLVTYNVQPGIYSSLISQDDADAKAQADIDANGQDYANANATCMMFCPDCAGRDKKCIDFECETGIKVYEGTSVWDPVAGKYRCYYHYEFSDGSWSLSNYDLSTTECFSAF